MESKNYVVAIDLGTSNVVIAVGEPTEQGVALAAIVSKPCQGVNAGQVENIELVAHAIDEAKEEIRRQLGIRLTEAYVGISGPYVRCASHSDYVFTADKLGGVSQADVDHLFDRMRNVQAPGDEVVMERIPQSYMTDNNVEVKNPVGSFSSKLSSTFNFILCAQTPIQRLELAMKRCGITLKEVFTNAQVLPAAVLSPEDKEEGSAVVNIGGGVTDVAVYYGNVLRYVAVIPMGGNAINRDIRSQSIAEKHVEPLKCRYGSAVAELATDTLVHIAGRTSRESKEIPRRNLATIIEARLKDIIDYVQQELKNSGYGQKLNYGLVLTGGSALLPDIDELFRRSTGLEVRIGMPEEGLTEASREAVQSPQWATAIGLLLRGSERGRCTTPMDEDWAREQAEAERRRQDAIQAQAEAERQAAEAAERQRAAAELAVLKQKEQQERERQQRIAELERQLKQNTVPVAPATPAAPQPKSAGTPQPAPQPVTQPVVEPEKPVKPAEPIIKPTEEPQPEKRPARNWKSFFSQTINTLNEKFQTVSESDDEEI